MPRQKMLSCYQMLNRSVFGCVCNYHNLQIDVRFKDGFKRATGVRPRRHGRLKWATSNYSAGSEPHRTTSIASAGKGQHARIVYEAGPCAYGLYRQLNE